MVLKSKFLQAYLEICALGVKVLNTNLKVVFKDYISKI